MRKTNNNAQIAYIVLHCDFVVVAVPLNIDNDYWPSIYWLIAHFAPECHTKYKPYSTLYSVNFLMILLRLLIGCPFVSETFFFILLFLVIAFFLSNDLFLFISILSGSIWMFMLIFKFSRGFRFKFKQIDLFLFPFIYGSGWEVLSLRLFHLIFQHYYWGKDF